MQKKSHRLSILETLSTPCRKCTATILLKKYFLQYIKTKNIVCYVHFTVNEFFMIFNSSYIVNFYFYQKMKIKY